MSVCLFICLFLVPRNGRNYWTKIIGCRWFKKFLDTCWAKSGYQTYDVENQGFVFSLSRFYADGICDEKLNIFECNLDTEMKWYDAVGISSVRMQHEFIMVGVSSADVFHEEAFDRSIETASVDEETIKISNVSMNNIDTTRYWVTLH